MVVLLVLNCWVPSCTDVADLRVVCVRTLGRDPSCLTDVNAWELKEDEHNAPSSEISARPTAQGAEARRLSTEEDLSSDRNQDLQDGTEKLDAAL